MDFVRDQRQETNVSETEKSNLRIFQAREEQSPETLVRYVPGTKLHK